MKMNFHAKSIAALLSATFLTLPVSAFAAPTSTEPGVIMKSLDSMQRTMSDLKADILGGEKEEPPAPTGQLSDVKTFTLKQVVLDKPNLYTPELVYNMYKDMVGQKVSFADLNVIAQRMTKKYRDDGWIFSRAVLYPQKVKDGIVHLRAVEGRIAHVEIVGNYTDRTGIIRRMADQIHTDRPANSKEIERYLLLINDLPGVTAKSFIKPSGEPNASDLIISIEERALEGSISADNRGSDYLGPYRGTLVGALNNTLGLHDRTTLRGILTAQTREMKFGDITHEEQIGHEGGKVTLRAAFTKTHPGGNVASQDIDGKSQMYDIEGQYPVTRNRQYNVYLLGGVNALDSKTDVVSIETANDKVRTVRAGARIDFTDRFEGVNQIEAFATQGIDELGANSDGLGRSRANGHHQFLKGTATVTRVQQLPYQFSAMVSGTGQISNNPLLASEEFSVGGQSFGRGYDAGELTGDNGYAGVAELRYGGPVDGDHFLQSYQAYTFIDYGKVKNQTVTVGESREDSLTSAGLGLRFNVRYDLSGYVEYAQPLTKVVASEGDDGSRFFFSVLKRF